MSWLQASLSDGICPVEGSLYTLSVILLFLKLAAFV